MASADQRGMADEYLLCVGAVVRSAGGILAPATAITWLDMVAWPVVDVLFWHAICYLGTVRAGGLQCGFVG